MNRERGQAERRFFSVERGVRSTILFGLSLWVSSTLACVSLSQPGHYDPPPAPERARDRSPLRASAVSFSGAPGDVLTNLDASFTAHLAGAALFAALTPASTDPSANANAGPDVLLRGAVIAYCQPITVFSDPHACVIHQSFGYSGMNMLLALITLGGWPAVSIFGVPTDWARGHAELSIAVLDPVSRLELARFASGQVDELGYAGLYYSSSPLANSLARAGELLIDALAAELPAIERRLAELEKPGRTIEEALNAKDPVLRARALIAVAREKNAAMSVAAAARATDEHPQVRAYAAEALEALEARDPAARGALELLSKDQDQRVSAAAHRALRALQFRAFAAAADEQTATWIAALESPASRLEALRRLKALGPAARAALDALMFVHERATPEEAQAIAEVVAAIGPIDRATEAALETLAARGSREAQLALAQLEQRRKTEPPQKTEPPPREADRAAPLVAVFMIDAAMLKAKDRAPLTDVLAALLTRSGGFRVVPSEAIKKELTRSKLASYSACVDESCQIELGKALAAEKVLRTQVIRQGSGCLTTATLYDLRTEASDRAAVAPSACTPAEFTRALARIAEELAPSR